MFLPADFKGVIADTFYDKTITKLAKSITTDSEGGKKKTGTTAAGTFKGNVRFTALGQLQSEIGLVEQIDIAITCDPATSMAVDDLFQYLGKKYVAVDVLPYDSHALIVGRKWQG